MTKQEFIDEANNSINEGITKRWGYAAKHDFLPDGIHCGLCTLAESFGHATHINDRCVCPIQYVNGADKEIDGFSCCCKEWISWGDAITSEECEKAAKAMIRRLQSLNVQECADAMERDGLFD